jgi:hypothetical protein
MMFQVIARLVTAPFRSGKHASRLTPFLAKFDDDAIIQVIGQGAGAAFTPS